MTSKKHYKKFNINPIQTYSQNVVNDTLKYQKQYGFDAGENNSTTWNNEADAFKHTFMQAQFALLGGKHLAKYIGDKHENSGNIKGQPSGESNMDLWNNNQGREIAREIIYENGPLSWPYNDKIKDIIAKKVMERMKQGKLITNPNDKRIYQENKPTGYAASVQNFNHIFTPQEIGDMTAEKFAQNEATIMQQMKDGLIQNQQPKINYSNYENSVSGHKEIFTREDIAKMSTKEFSKYEKAINAQMKEIGIPSKNELPKNTTTHIERKQKVNSNNSADGKWVTINGNHVLIDK